jgi:hypothetical protein
LEVGKITIFIFRSINLCLLMVLIKQKNHFNNEMAFCLDLIS